MKEFAAHNVSFISATQSIETHTPEGKLSMNMMAVVADYEAAMIRARLRDKINACKAQGRWVGGNAPYGYRWANKRLEIDPPAATATAGRTNGWRLTRRRRRRCATSMSSTSAARGRC